MATLSQWDMQHFTPEEQAKAIELKSQWGVDPTQNESLHAALEAMRGQYNYSGGVDGSQFIPNDMYNAPKAPIIEPYGDPYGVEQIVKDLANIPKWKDPYEDMITEQISAIANRPDFEYNADTDPAYQAFRERAIAAGDKAFSDNLAGLSSMTGGRANSWAGTVATQARNEYLAQADEAVFHFEDRAYSRYRDETADMYNLVNLLQTQSQSAYNRFRDTVTDQKDLANMVMKLDERGYQQYMDLAENKWRIFETEYNQFKDVLDSKQNAIANAIDRTNLTGFVNNKDAITLGVPVGTLSQGARERAEDMLDYITKSEIDLENDYKRMQMDYEFDMKIANARASSGGGSYSRGGGGTGTAPTDYNAEVSFASFKRRDETVAEFVDITETEEFKALNPKQKFESIQQWENRITNEAMYNGRFGDWEEEGAIVLGLVFQKLAENDMYVKYYNDYVMYEDYFGNTTVPTTRNVLDKDKGYKRGVE